MLTFHIYVTLVITVSVPVPVDCHRVGILFVCFHTIQNKGYKYHRHQEHTHRFVLSVSFTLSHAKKHTYHQDDERLVFRLRAWLGLILWGCTIWLGSYIYSLGSCQSVLLNCRICCSSYDNSPCAKFCTRSLSNRTTLSLSSFFP